MKNISIAFLILSIIVSLSASTILFAQENNRLSNGQTIYVPAYSHIYTGNKDLPSLLAVTLSIRNTDQSHLIKIMAVEYYDTQGKLLKKFISSPLVINVLGTKRFSIPLRDKTGGSGANFIIKWEADRPVNPPIVETIMVGSRLSFTSRGQAIIPSN